MPLVENYHGYQIHSAVAAVVTQLAATSTAHRVIRPDGERLAGGPFKTIQDAKEAVDEHRKSGNRYVLDAKLDNGSSDEKWVVDTTCHPRRRGGMD